MKKRWVVAVVLALVTTLTVQADGRIDQHVKTELGGGLGKVANFLGGKKAKEGISQEIRLRGDRMLTRTGRHGELIDLAEEKIYKIDFKKRRYEVMTFEEMRQQMAQVKESLGGAMPWKKQKAASENSEKPEGPEYVADVEVDETGGRLFFAGHECHEVIITITVHIKDQTLEEGGGAVLTATTWQGPKLAEMTEWREFQLRYIEKLGVFGEFKQSGEQIARTLMRSPALQQAMTEFREHQEAFEGTPLRTITTLETVAGPGAPAGESADEEGSSSIGGMFKGLGSKLRRRGSDDESGEAAAQGSGGRKMAFRTTSEISEVSSVVSADDVAIPAGFRQK